MTRSYFKVISGAILVKGYGKFKSGVDYPLSDKGLYDLVAPLQQLGDVLVHVDEAEMEKFGIAETKTKALVAQKDQVPSEQEPKEPAKPQVSK